MKTETTNSPTVGLPVIRILLLGAMALTPGCTGMTARRSEQGPRPWDQVRSGIKVQLARQQYDRGQIDTAIGLLEEACTWDPNNAEALTLLAQCRLEQGQFAAAQRAAERAASLDVSSAELAAVRGVIAERMMRYDDAMRYYRQARVMDDTSVSYLMAEAECLVVLSRPEEAVELLSDQLIRFDNEPAIHALIGEIALRIGNDELALRSFGTVLADRRFDPVLAEEYALLAVRSRRFAEALPLLNQLVGQHESEVPASVLRAAAVCMLTQNQTESAKLTLTRLVDREPGDAEAWMLLAACGMMTDDLQTARRGATQAVRLWPGAAHAVLIDAYASLQAGDVAHARASLERVVAAGDGDPLACYLTGVAAEMGDDPSAAARYYRRALQIDPQCSLARQALEQH